MAAGLTHLVASDFERDQLKRPGWWLVDLSTTWCPPCRRLMPKLQELAGSYQGRVEFAHINPEEDGPEVSTDLKVQAFPTLVLFRDGVRQATRVGDLPKGSLAAWIEGTLAEAQ